jgi:glycosyltransferase involved in cell wall biosynthesis
MSRVLIVKSKLEPFRMPFYAQLERRLAQEAIELQVAAPARRCGQYRFAWLLPVPALEFSVAGKRICYQFVSGYAGRADLVIVQQVARELTNYALLALRSRTGFKLALWGHGTEFQRSWTNLAARPLKSLFSTVDYWFAYAPAVAEIVAQTGYPRERICAVFNSIDTQSEQRFHALITEEKKNELRAQLGIQPGARLICYCGSLYKAKRLDFLIEACKLVRGAGSDLHLAVLGDGAEKRHLERLSAEAPWLHVVGAAEGERKALFLGVSECMAIPGVVGLAVVDAFTHECPLITTDIRGHGPEIEYLVHRANGLKVANDVSTFAEAIRSVMEDVRLKDELRRGCRQSASKLTLSNMVDHFAQGVLAALRLPEFGQVPNGTSKAVTST